MTTDYLSESLTKDDLLGEHLSDLVNDSVKRHSKNKAFSCVLPTGHHAGITFEELGYYTDCVAAYLREELGLVPGDVVAIQSPNTLGYPVVAFGIAKAGLIITNVNPLYTDEETQYQLQDSRAKVLFTIDVFGNRLAQSVSGTQVSKVIRLSVADLFPTLQRTILQFGMRYIKKVVPKPNRPFDTDLACVLKKGAKHLRAGADLAAYRAAASGEDIAFYQYTGGTTGRSKGAELTHTNVVSNISQGHKRNKDFMKGREDTLALALPMYHVYALAAGAMASMYHGIHVVLVPVPRPVSNMKVVFDTFNITLMPGVNTLYIALLAEPWFKANPPKSLRICYSGAAPLLPQTAQDWFELTGAAIYEGYGLTESTCVVSSMPLGRPPKPGTCGRPVPGTEVRLVGSDGQDMPAGEAGELWVRGPQIMKGYLGQPEATAATVTEDGWLKTGDIARIDDEGYISIVDRIKDMVIISGFNVYPTDIEAVLTRHPGVSDAAVVGVPSQETGEALVAYVTPSRADENLTAKELRAHVREHLTGYKVPKLYEIVDDLPKSPVGKVLRREVRDMARKKYSDL